MNKAFKLLGVTTLSVMLFAPVAVPDEVVAPCEPFAMTNVPDESDPMWQLRPDVSYDDGTRSRQFYKTDSGLRLGVYSYFGELAWKAWSCVDENGKRIDHQVAILKEGVWYRAYTEHPHLIGSVDETNLLLWVEVYLNDPDTGEEIVRRRFAPRP